MTTAKRQATSLRQGQFRHLIRVAGVTGRMPLRDQMILWITHTTGIRVTELALLRIDDVLHQSGAIREEVYLRAAITKGCRARNIHLTNSKCTDAIDAWLAERRVRGWGVSSDGAYRGFLPHSKLVLTHKGRSFELAVKRRVLDTGVKEYRACDALQQTMSRLYRQAGIKLGSSHSGRRTLAARVLAATGDVETVQAVLGHQELDHTKPYLTVDQETIRRAFALALV